MDRPHPQTANVIAQLAQNPAPHSCPSLSVVTPSFNQARFLEEAMRSVLDQRYPRLEYVVIDGASRDGSVELLKRYSPQLHGWISEPDRGPEDAINKGFARTTGEIMAWIGSSDKYLPWAFSLAAAIFSRFPEVEWLTTLYPVHWNEEGRARECYRMPGYHRAGFFRGEYLNIGGRWRARGWIQAESTFWRRSLWEKAGAHMDPREDASDFDLWARFYEHAPLWGVEAPLAGYRIHEGQLALGNEPAYFESALRILQRHGGRPRSRLGSSLLIRRLPRLPRTIRDWLARRRWWPCSPVIALSDGPDGLVQRHLPILDAHAPVSPSVFGL